MKMDNIKTGNLIRELRKEKGITQKDLADQLHITDRAVSKWERGLCAPDIALLEPLSQILGVKITDIISGTKTADSMDAETERKVNELLSYSEDELNKKTKSYKKTVIILSVIAGLSLLLWVFNFFSPVIFQRGNPIPYISAAMKIDEDSRYVQVNVDDTYDVYISVRGDKESLFYDLAYSKGMEFVEQAGSSYIFSDGKNRLIISSEVYLSCFTVWKVRTNTIAAP